MLAPYRASGLAIGEGSTGLGNAGFVVDVVPEVSEERGVQVMTIIIISMLRRSFRPQAD